MADKEQSRSTTKLTDLSLCLGSVFFVAFLAVVIILFRWQSV